MAIVELGPLAASAIEKEFPECWKVLADMTGNEYEYDEEGKTVLILIGDEELLITEDNRIECSSPLSKELVTQTLIHIIKTKRGK